MLPPAPIIVSVYDRLEHLKSCLASLARNPAAPDSPLFIVSDGPKTEEARDRILSIRDFAGAVRGFGTTTVLARESNLGSFQSVKSAIDEILPLSGRAIFLEDDNVVSPNFLEFLNEGLGFYEDDPSVFSISAYGYPVAIPPAYGSAVYAWPGFSAWGVGLWADRWASVQWSYDGFEDVRRDRRRRRAMDRNAEHLARYIKSDLEKGRMIIDTVVSFRIFLRKQYSLFPVVSKVRNIGHDGSGEHGGRADLYRRQEIDPGGPSGFVAGIRPDERIGRVLRKHFRVPFPAKIRSALGERLTARQRDWLKSHLGFLGGKSPERTSRS